ncbi:putative DNA topoisomerase (ATP-hydrolyzing) [Helianthus annuus]|nr:putative DNA topoisomerase (ATP-hydrolyzing) [Helianthus annuus]
MGKRRRADSDSDFDDDTTTTTRLPFKNRLKPDSVILSTLKTLTAATKSASTSKTLTLTDLSLSSTCREVTDLPLSSVQNRILTLTLNLTKSILTGNSFSFSFSVPSRAATNRLYVPELDCIVLKNKSFVRP